MILSLVHAATGAQVFSRFSAELLAEMTCRQMRLTPCSGALFQFWHVRFWMDFLERSCDREPCFRRCVRVRGRQVRDPLFCFFPRTLFFRGALRCEQDGVTSLSA